MEEKSGILQYNMKEDKMENFKTRELNASDYHKDHPYMKSLDKALSHYVATRSLIGKKDIKDIENGRKKYQWKNLLIWRKNIT